MALKIPECNVRIRALWEAVRNTRPGLSQRSWAAEHKIDTTLFNNWLKETQPDLRGLRQLERAFGVPWEWILLGDEGIAALKAYDRPLIKAPPSTALPPVKDAKGRERKRARG